MMRRLVLFAAALVVAGATGCSKKAVAPAQTLAAPKQMVVAVAAVTNAAWDKTVAITGTLFAKDTAVIAAQVEGQVDRTLVDFGDRVKTAEDLAFIDTASYDALLQQASGNSARAEATFRNAQQNFDRVQRLRKEGVASESDFDSAKAAFDQADADLKALKGTEAVARLNLQRSRVQAPFDGAIAQRSVSRGDFVKIGSPLYEMVNDAVLKFIFPVPERYASYVEKGLPITFSVDNYPGEVFTGRVYLISPAVNQASRAFSVGALVTNTDFRLKANTFGRGQLVVAKAVPTPVVPVESIVSFAGVTKVFVVENGLARSRPIKAGRIQNGVQEIVDGVKEGEMVVVSGQTRLSDGMKVVIRENKLPDESLAYTKTEGRSAK
jgi:membrane fusion protein (multidrug efflux system)